MASVSPNIEASWKEVLREEFEKPYFLRLTQFLLEEAKSGQVIYPPTKDIFTAFSLTPFDKVSVVIIGQDPYHGAGQAHGLCFSVKQGVAIPPSLQNIYKEMHDDLGIAIPTDGDLTDWAKRGVLLINAVMTVRKDEPGSHAGKGWEEFTTAVIKHLSDKKEGLVFMLWGKYAQEKGAIIDKTKHLVLEAPHPSPFSVHKGFFGCGHFGITLSYLREHGLAVIPWEK